MLALNLGQHETESLSNQHVPPPKVRLAGHYVTVLLDSSSFDAVLNDTISLDLSRSRNLLLKKIFFLQLPDIKAASVQKWNEQ